MPGMARRYLLRCRACGADEDCGPDQILEKLRRLGMFRRESQPPPEVLDELLARAAARLACGACHKCGLEVRSAGEVSWGDARRCLGCGGSIARERLELFPETELCAACQQKSERAGGGVPEYCPKCGNVMALRPVHGRGVTHYRLTCPQCRR